MKSNKVKAKYNKTLLRRGIDSNKDSIFSKNNKMFAKTAIDKEELDILASPVKSDKRF